MFFQGGGGFSGSQQQHHQHHQNIVNSNGGGSSNQPQHGFPQVQNKTYQNLTFLPYFMLLRYSVVKDVEIIFHFH